ncbi:MAG TPA: dipeptide epimerase, partial [Rhodopila sp.]|nr:dipeptide epimerase [Rhodopila sp.]
MIINNVKFEPCELPLEDKNWKFALGSASTSRGWIVRIGSDDGHTGHGYANASPHMGSTFEALPHELERFKPIVLGKDPFAIEAILQELDASLSGGNQAKAGIDCALHDLCARALGVPLYNLLGGKVRSSVPVLRILAIKTPTDMAAQAGKLLDQGYRYFKIKVHGDVEEDVARVKAIRERVGKDAHLTIDANQSYSPKDAIAAIKRMAEFRIDLVEQPVSKRDLKGLELVTRSVPVTVEADEAAGTLDEIMTLVVNRIVDAVSLKIPKLGGLRNALAAARICEAGKIRCRLGAHVGTRLVNAHAIHLAAALPHMDYACELGEFSRMFNDPFMGIEVVDGTLTVPDGPGCGVELVTGAQEA